MTNASYKKAFIKLAIALLIILGGAVCIPVLAQAEPKARGQLNTVSINVEGAHRYISAYGVPRHAGSKVVENGIKVSPYAFRVNAKPKTVASVVNLSAQMFFGVALDGVPFYQNEGAQWNGRADWTLREEDLDKNGGFKNREGHYFYGGIPSTLISKDLSHVGYAADGFPVFVSKDSKFSSSYKLKEGKRPKGTAGPGGRYDGRYFSDYTYVHRSGALDRCNGLKVKDKYYIYVLSSEFPQVPLCWSGVPDSSFSRRAGQSSSSKEVEAVSGTCGKRRC